MVKWWFAVTEFLNPGPHTKKEFRNFSCVHACAHLCVCDFLFWKKKKKKQRILPAFLNGKRKISNFLFEKENIKLDCLQSNFL